ncbi:DNA-binding transcriptional regulator Fis [Salinicola endophyticus]|uniref:Putative Fis-like DNA-binding protein n=2 Tax=Salinicola endophyticus TaxID=1949083 RepID=A0ABY8FKS7_9GAMM|nr:MULTISPECIES: DNA-binding transcriptional regulator Fis [Salinicola]WFF43414.1 DNA-binding transcriptional regulator Fis [Salinicola endophyticus]
MNSRQPLDLDGNSPLEVESLHMAEQSSQVTLRECVEQVMERYFTHLEGESVSHLYTMVLAEVEAPLLDVVMRHVEGNQTRAAELLGLNRGTLRKKLKQYDLI